MYKQSYTSKGRKQRKRKKNNDDAYSSSSFVVRSDNVNEEYYAKDNSPNFHQFKTYHFYDDMGRFYKIAEKNNQVFQNERFNTNAFTGKSNYQRSPLLTQTTTRSQMKEKRCVIDSNGYLKLFVRLPNSKIAWFSSSSIDKFIHVKEYHSGEIQGFKLRSAFKYNQKRLTGTIYVSNIDKNYCNRLLNE